MTDLREILWSRDLDALHVALAAGVDPDRRTDPWTEIDPDPPSHTCVVQNWPQALKLLLDHGGDPLMRSDQGDALAELGARYDRVACLEVLLSHPATRSRRLEMGKQVARVALMSGAAGSLRYLFGESPVAAELRTSLDTYLGLAVAQGRLPCIEVLLAAGADPHARANPSPVPAERRSACDIAEASGRADILDLLRAERAHRILSGVPTSGPTPEAVDAGPQI